jgi:NAD(P)-dependent dehydrogenase (short-subunit alcohol dehydrogenase family)
MSLDGKTVVVTGAYGNLGQAVAARLASQGARLVLVGRSANSLDAAFPGEDAGRLNVAVDLVDQAATDAALNAAAERLGAIDGLCAIAGGFAVGKLVHEMPAAHWQAMFDLNVATLLNAVHAVVPGMMARGYGRIVTVGAGGALKAGARMAAYAAAKSSVMRITEAMAAELRPSGISANCVLPSVIDTPENRAAMPKADPSKWVAPEDIAATIAFLVSPEARAVNGAMVAVG